MESKKLEKPRKNGAFSTRQAVTKPDEETGGVFPTMKPTFLLWISITKSCSAFGKQSIM